MAEVETELAKEIREAELRELEAAAKKKRRRTAIVAGCLMAVVFSCCFACGLGMLGASRHATDVRTFTPIPAPSAAGETDPYYALVASARASVVADGLCEPAVEKLRLALVELPDAEVRAFHEWLRARMAELDVQAVRDACAAATYGGCREARFFSYRAYLVAMGRPTVERALRDPDTLASMVVESPACEEMTWVALAALREQAGRSDAGMPEEPAPIPYETTTRMRERLELPSVMPRTCARFSCAPGDIFD